MQKLVLYKKIDTFLLIALGMFSLLLLPFTCSIPYLDGNIDFVQSYDFYTGGFNRYFQKWRSVHPPFKLWLTDILYAVFGIHPFVYNIIGLLFGIIGIISLFGLAKIIMGRQTARFSGLLLSLSPLFLACSLFAMRDFILTALLLASLYFYSKRHFVWYAVCASAMLLTKETGVLLSLSIVFIEFLYGKMWLKEKDKIKKIWCLFVPLLTFLGWLWFLSLNHQKAWGDWLFTPTADKGTFYTILYNLGTLHVFNPYANEQWLHLFVLNFNWVYWLTIFIGLIWSLPSLKQGFLLVKQGNQQTKTVMSLLIFSFLYILLILTIQTYTIPRYVLPVVPCMIIGVAWSIQKILKHNTRLGIVGSIIIFSTTSIALFFSFDPLSAYLWGKTTVMDQSMYGLNNGISGGDGITYNMQYLFMAKQRSDILTDKIQARSSSECLWLFKDPNNEKKTFQILQISNYVPC